MFSEVQKARFEAAQASPVASATKPANCTASYRIYLTCIARPMCAHTYPNSLFPAASRAQRVFNLDENQRPQGDFRADGHQALAFWSAVTTAS
jgi:hypothetical protein